MNYGDIITELAQQRIAVYSLINRAQRNESIDKIGQVKVVSTEKDEDYSDYDDCGTEYYIIEFVNHNLFIKVEEYTDSYGSESYPYGYGWEVKPTTKTVKTFE